MRFTELLETTLGGFKVKPIHIQNSGSDDAELKEQGTLKDTSLAVLMQARQDLEQKRAAEIAAWEQDFRKNTAQLAGQQLKQTFQPAPVAQPDQSHSELRAQLSMLDAVIKKQQQLDALGAQAEKMTLLNEPDVVDDLNTSMYVRDAVRNNRYDYTALNKRLDTVIPRVSNRIAQKRAAYSKPRAMREALKVDAPTVPWSRRDLHGYMDRIKTGTTTKSDKFKPIIHASNVKALLKSDNPEDKWDLDDFAQQIITPPTQILGTNAKMAKSKEEGAITYDLTLPALSGIVVDEETGEFVEVTTCPGAGECQTFCYARKGGYRMFPASSMSAGRALNFLMNHPKEYMGMFNQEVKQSKAKARKSGIKLLVRIHDAGDFFSKEYYNLAMDVAIDNPDVTFYFYTKMGEIVTDASAPKNVVGQFSGGAQSKQNKIVKLHKDAGKHVKDAIQLGKDEFRGLFKTDAKGKYVKDEKGRTQVKSPEDWTQFKQHLAGKYKIDPDSIITYDQMVRIPEGPKPKWNVVVFPAGHGDLGAPRLDVQNQFLMFH